MIVRNQILLKWKVKMNNLQDTQPSMRTLLRNRRLRPYTILVNILSFAAILVFGIGGTVEFLVSGYANSGVFTLGFVVSLVLLGLAVLVSLIAKLEMKRFDQRKRRD